MPFCSLALAAKIRPWRLADWISPKPPRPSPWFPRHQRKGYPAAASWVRKGESLGCQIGGKGGWNNISKPQEATLFMVTMPLCAGALPCKRTPWVTVPRRFSSRASQGFPSRSVNYSPIMVWPWFKNEDPLRVPEHCHHDILGRLRNLEILWRRRGGTLSFR